MPKVEHMRSSRFSARSACPYRAWPTATTPVEMVMVASRFRAFPFRAFPFPVLRFRGFPLPAPTPRPFRPKVVPRLSKFPPALLPLLPLLQLHLSPPFRWLLPPPRLQPRP